MVFRSKMSKIISRLIIFGLLGIGLGSDQEEGRIEEDKPIGEQYLIGHSVWVIYFLKIIDLKLSHKLFYGDIGKMHI